MSELKSCPFCGKKATLTHSYDPDGCYWAYIKCNGCEVRSRGKWTSVRSDACPLFYEEVRDEWNTRAQAATGAQVTDEMVEAAIIAYYRLKATNHINAFKNDMRAALEAALAQRKAE
jgi:hypothetical protein